MLIITPTFYSAFRLLRNLSYSLEKSHRLFIVRDEHIFVVAIMVEHHLVVFAPEAALFVAAERSVRWVIVIAVDPDASGFDGSRNLIKLMRVARPDARA